MAKQVLHNAQWFDFGLSEALKDDIAKLMQPVDASDGHCFCEEGKPINQFLIIEKGTLTRTKHLKTNKPLEDDQLQVDELGPGKVTGFLHVAGYVDEPAYATLSAKGEARVWTVDGNAFQEMLA